MFGFGNLDVPEKKIFEYFGNDLKPFPFGPSEKFVGRLLILANSCMFHVLFEVDGMSHNNLSVVKMS